MRILMLGGAAVLALAIPGALAAQQTADQANAQAQPAPPTTTVTTTPARPAQTTVTTTPGQTTVTTTPAQPPQTTITTSNPGNLTPPPASAMNKTYPVCTRTLQDSCQNPGEGGAPRSRRG
ncbi:MAG TPA: hypothetical protein VFS49_00100 [Croceibacterium sp.]|nr:hypothetical protein [Croceibacterium sp.]